jgi:ubiquinone/menaquinone biosynthesis C-methylase UbiE
MPTTLEAILDNYCAALSELPATSVDQIVLSTLGVAITLEDIFAHPERDPGPFLEACLHRQFGFVQEAKQLAPHLERDDRGVGGHVDTGKLFEAAWTTYTPATYDHSVSLIEQRFRRSGLDEAFFAGKVCFDGGAGTGRLSIAAARMGAAKVVAVDIGQRSLDFLNRQVVRLGITNIITEQADVTDLSRWPDASFDFVASYGVLHHTPDCIRGLREHFRILKPGGTLWLYLYGDGGMYWPVYDRLRLIVARLGSDEVKLALQRMKLREGLIYTYLDNVLASRTYHYESDILAVLLGTDAGATYRRANGSSTIDDVDLCLSTPFGRVIAGPEGEVRLVVKRSE